MTAINVMCSNVTAMYKFYHTNKSRFLTAVSTTTEYPHDFFAVTVHTTTTTSRTIIHFAKDSAGVWKSTTMKHASTSAAVEITGSAIGNFQRIIDRVYFGDEQNDTLMIIPRRSAGDTNVNTVYNAGLPDPNAELVIDRMIETGSWVSSGDGTYTASVDRMPTHRLYGDGAIMITQQDNAKTVSITLYQTADLTKFSDGTTIGNSDFVSFNVYRYTKQPIESLKFIIGCDAVCGTWTNYFHVPLTLAYNSELDDLESSATWTAYEFRQNTIMAEWENNPYDNQFFRVRIRKSTFARVGTPTWTSVEKFRFELQGGATVSASNPAQVTINDLKFMKAGPITSPYRVQWFQFEEIESGSTDGWVFTSSHTPVSKFNRQMAKEGVSCIKINGGGPTSPVASIDFSTNRDFVTFPDGTTANTSCLLRYQLAWRGLGKVGQLVAGVAGVMDVAGVYTLPQMKFIDGSGGWAKCYLGVNASLTGGGVPQQIRFNTDNADGSNNVSPWTGSATAMDWTDIARVEIYGPYYDSTAIESYYFIDDMRLEWPKAARPVNLFEPVDIHILNAAEAMIKAYLPAFATLAELGNAFAQAWLRDTKYKTHGFGVMTYPDYEHSSFGLSACTLTCGGGNQPFGVTMEIDGAVSVDLANFYVPTLNPSYEWDWPKKWGYIQFETIPGSTDDEFSLWVARPKGKKYRGQELNELIIKIHGNDGSNNADLDNYWEYRISGQQLDTMVAQQAQEDKLQAQRVNYYAEAVQDKRLNDLVTLQHNLMNNPKDVQKFKADTIELLGKDRGDWYSGTIKWRKSDMILIRKGNDVSPSWSDIRGHGFEITSVGGSGCTVSLDNFMMRKQGALEGTYWYKLLLEDDQGFKSPSSEPTTKITVEREDVQLNDIYVPSTRDLKRIQNKKLYRMGGSSTEWREVGDLSPSKTTFLDKKKDSDLGLIMPQEAYAPPKAKVMRAIGSTMYYGNVTDRFGIKLPYRIYKSEGFCPYRVSDFAAVDIPERRGAGITGIEEWFQYLMVWTPDGMYTVDKLFTQVPIRRSDKGCIAEKSVQHTPYGVVWLSRDGLMMGNISQVDDKFFRPINPLFTPYTEDELANAIGVYREDYYYLFFDPSNASGGRVACCYLPDRLFSEFQSDALDVKSVCMWQGDEDNNVIMIGRTNGEIAKFLDGETDNGTAIGTDLRTKDFSEPGIQHDKYARALYMSVAKLGATGNATLTPYFYAGQSSIDTAPVESAETTALKTVVAKATQGDYGTHLGVRVTGSNMHKITEMVFKIETEEDVEFHV